MIIKIAVRKIVKIATIESDTNSEIALLHPFDMIVDYCSDWNDQTGTSIYMVEPSIRRHHQCKDFSPLIEGIH